eukprot:12884303-Prorocentrum_lima.AAC.1
MSSSAASPPCVVPAACLAASLAVPTAALPCIRMPWMALAARALCVAWLWFSAGLGGRALCGGRRGDGAAGAACRLRPRA